MPFHVIKRDSCPLSKKILYYVIAIVIALLIGAAILAAIGVNPLSYYFNMATMGMVGNRIAYKAFENYLKVFVPLVLTSVALSFAFKMRFWNIGGEGQFIMGSLAAAFVAFKFGPVLPQALTLLLMCVGAVVVAGVYGCFVAALKVKFGTNETLLTLMLNYIALYIIIYFANTAGDWNIFLNPNSARTTFGSFAEYASWPGIPIGRFTLNICVIFTIIICIIAHIYLKRTKHGYEIAVVGDSPNSARYAGMNVGKIIVRTVFLSAALIGLAAAFKVGTAGILSTAITGNVGWTGVIVAWLAKLSTGGIFIVSALISILNYGSTVAASTFGAVDANFANMLQGMILFAVLVADFFCRFRLVRTEKAAPAAAAVKADAAEAAEIPEAPAEAEIPADAAEAAAQAGEEVSNEQ
ncbi:MAG: ABC transporter permease [Lachnospiraceae bacterium]|nr:ABC transporter permease [Lachnospiraceae bacterium]